MVFTSLLKESQGVVDTARGSTGAAVALSRLRKPAPTGVVLVL
jgi:hypothetical protein